MSRAWHSRVRGRSQGVSSTAATAGPVSDMTGSDVPDVAVSDVTGTVNARGPAPPTSAGGAADTSTSVTVSDVTARIDSSTGRGDAAGFSPRGQRCRTDSGGRAQDVTLEARDAGPAGAGGVAAGARGQYNGGSRIWGTIR